ncbi:unnamed protein product [Mesocestoides corti]|nr:unnamed protein product [Mesocestoides corti]
MDENWYYACSLDRKKVGLIPRNFIDIRVDVVNSSNFKYSSANPEIPSRPAETEIPQTQTVEKALKLREPSDVFCKVLQEFESQTDEDLSAKLDEIILWVDEEAEKGRLIPEDWIKCMNLAGKVGTFPGNLVVALTSDAEIDEALTRSPHAIALKEFTSNEDDLVPVNFGEAVFIDKVADGFIFGRTASGHIGKIPLEICKMAGSAF